MRHFKNHGPLTLNFYSAVETQEINAIDNFDDRTLASLVGSTDGGRPTLPSDGHDNDNPYNSLPLGRWQDRTRRGGSR